MKKRCSGLEEHPVAAMKELSKKMEVLKRYFYFDSRTWHAIIDHIWKSPECVLIDRISKHYGASVSIPCHRGTGPSISLRKFHSYSDDYDAKHKPVPAKVFNLDLEVEYEFDEESGQNFTNHYSIQVPCHLEDDCDDKEWKKRWNVWLVEMKEKHNKKERDTEIPKLKALMEKYPDVVVENFPERKENAH